MATLERRRRENVDGDLYVDSTCIDCDTCRWMAPSIYARVGSMSAVVRQPESAEERHEALLALVACPTASIGSSDAKGIAAASRAFPVPVTERVLHCGYHAESSFGAASYLLLRDQGNVLVDSPRFSGPLVKRLEELGGVATLFLSHRDDVADHQRFRDHFGCERILHAGDARGDLANVERLIEGTEPVELADDLLLLPMPGHTEGSMCLLASSDDGHRYLFTGDHLAWSETEQNPYAFRRACWFDWNVQIESMDRLVAHDFDWVLPGHGRRCTFPVPEMRERLTRTVQWMRDRA